MPLTLSIVPAGIYLSNEKESNYFISFRVLEAWSMTSLEDENNTVASLNPSVIASNSQMNNSLSILKSHSRISLNNKEEIMKSLNDTSTLSLTLDQDRIKTIRSTIKNKMKVFKSNSKTLHDGKERGFRYLLSLKFAEEHMSVS